MIALSRLASARSRQLLTLAHLQDQDTRRQMLTVRE